MGEIPHGEPRNDTPDLPAYAFRSMETNRTSRAEEPASAPARFGTDPPGRLQAIEEETVNSSAPHPPLPGRTDRQEILDRANLILAEARAIAAHSQRLFGSLSAGRTAETTDSAASSSL